MVATKLEEFIVTRGIKPIRLAKETGICRQRLVLIRTGKRSHAKAACARLLLRAAG